jgi:hypothetical protein
VLTEGGNINLASNNIRVITDYYVDKIEDYLIVDPPTSGRLIAVPSGGLDVIPKANEKTVTIFSTEDLDERRIKVGRVIERLFTTMLRSSSKVHRNAYVYGM